MGHTMFDAAISFVCHERLIMNWFESGRHSLAADRRGHAKLDLEEGGRDEIQETRVSNKRCRMRDMVRR